MGYADYNNYNIAGMVKVVSEIYDKKPHAKKALMASLNDKMKKFYPVARENFHQHKHMWPLTLRAILQWKTFLKDNPYKKTKAEIYSPEAQQLMLSIDTGKCLKTHCGKVYAAIFNFSAIRAETMDHMLSKNVTKHQHTEDLNRYFRFQPEYTKAHRDGEVKDEAMQSLVGCICMEGILDVEDKVAFCMALERDPWTPCRCPCPFGLVWEYLCEKRLPDPHGEERVKLRVTQPGK